MSLILLFQNCSGFSTLSLSTSTVGSSENGIISDRGNDMAVSLPLLDVLSPDQQFRLKSAFEDLHKGLELKTHLRWNFFDQSPDLLGCFNRCIHLILNDSEAALKRLPDSVAIQLKEKRNMNVDGFF